MCSYYSFELLRLCLILQPTGVTGEAAVQRSREKSRQGRNYKPELGEVFHLLTVEWSNPHYKVARLICYKYFEITKLKIKDYKINKL